MLSEKLDSKANEKERAVQGSDPNPSTTIIPPEENKETLLQAETETDVEPSSEEAPNGEANSAKSTDLQSVIEQREAQLMKMMHQNAELNDSLSKIGKEKADMQQKMDSLEAEVRNMVRSLIVLLSATLSHAKPG